MAATPGLLLENSTRWRGVSEPVHEVSKVRHKLMTSLSFHFKFSSSRSNTGFSSGGFFCNVFRDF